MSPETAVGLGSLLSLALLWALNNGLNEILIDLSRAFQPFYDGKSDRQRPPALVRAMRRRRMAWCVLFIVAAVHLHHDRGINGVVLEIANICAGISVVYFLMASYEFWTEHRQAKQQRDTFSSGLL